MHMRAKCPEPVGCGVRQNLDHVERRNGDMEGENGSGFAGPGSNPAVMVFASIIS